jgi:hypothetical protein
VTSGLQSISKKPCDFACHIFLTIHNASQIISASLPAVGRVRRLNVNDVLLTAIEFTYKEHEFHGTPDTTKKFRSIQEYLNYSLVLCHCLKKRLYLREIPSRLAAFLHILHVLSRNFELFECREFEPCQFIRLEPFLKIGKNLSERLFNV